MRKIIMFVSLIAGLLFMLSSLAFADIPHRISYQGYLTDNDGSPQIDIILEMNFTIYDDSLNDVNLLWSESHSNVEVDSGYFTVILGIDNPIPDSVFNNQNTWLEIEVEGDTVSPRTQLISVPYSYRVNSVDKALGGSIKGSVEVDGNAQINDTLFVSGAIGIGVDNPEYKVHLEDGAIYNSYGHVDDIIANLTVKNTNIVYPDTPVNGTWGIKSTAASDGLAPKFAIYGRALGANGRNFGGYFVGDGYFSGKLGIGTNEPNFEFHIADGEMRSYCSFVNNFNANLHVDNWNIFPAYQIYNGTYGIRSYVSSSGTENKYAILGQAGGNGKTFAGYFVGDGYFSNKLGIGTDEPDENLHVDGNAKVTGTIINEPDYDSGWFTVNLIHDTTLAHGLGDDESKYKVIMDGKNSYGIHQANIGTIVFGLTSQLVAGCEWFKLTNSEITVSRGVNDEDIFIALKRRWNFTRIRIWKNQ